VSTRLTLAIVLAALTAAAGVVAVVLTSDNEDVGTVFAVFWPAVGCSFVGTGLRGLADRVAALDGRLWLDSPAGQGTRVHVEIPIA
jgi:signal transduction histidine kinase